MSLAEILIKTPNLIQFDFGGDTKKDVISSIVEVLSNEGLLNDKQVFEDDVFKRESEYSTGIGMGIAIPHARSNGVNETCFTIVKLKNNVEWESLDGDPVSIVIMLAVPANETGDFLKLLSTLSYNLMNDEFRTGIVNASSKEKIISIFQSIDKER
ncbi:hypothetical protein AOC36_08305 [Erysipelothrix larvae]|uniref:PTS EIIA type-2 domain-containing protein n=1 Tax=Erysipelothrix larvae TaxID=1514105 RepID=A0A0X8H0S8_9FIRM|nr:PTS sugar transporter subunit IIA [Erysipelothrix larvae]AMC93987.1 hypothetical protein AOC36_08305 [Erysipelothrix larvae]